jgi:hypothetical protein
MTSSGGYAIDPSVASFTDEAWERCGKDPATLSIQQLRSVRRSMNFLLSDWANRGSKEWAIDEQSQLLTQATITYNAPVATMDILTMVLRRNGVDTPIYQMSRDDYLLIPSKTQQGLPTRFQFNRNIGTQTFNLWTAPENSTDYVYYNRLRRQQDVLTAAETVDLNYNWFEAFAAGLACKLAIKYAPDRYKILKGEAEETFKIAMDNEREQGVDTQMSVSLSR